MIKINSAMSEILDDFNVSSECFDDTATMYQFLSSNVWFYIWPLKCKVTLWCRVSFARKAQL